MLKKIFISYNHHNSKEVDVIVNYIKKTFKVNILIDSDKINHLDNLNLFMQNIRDADRVITFLSDEYFRSENCMYEVTELIKSDTLRQPFLEKVIPIIYSKSSDTFKLPEWETQNIYIEHWLEELIKTEEHLKQYVNKKEQSGYGNAFDPILKRDMNRIKKITSINESLDQFFTGICSQLYFNHGKLLENNFSLFYDVLVETFETLNNEHRPQINFSKNTLKEIIERIQPNSYSDPNNPEFPYDNPSYPATKTLKISYKGKDILIKDESSNPTGTHKDRMAWEVMIYYKRKLLSLLNSENDILKIPNLSIISSGSSALAIQNLLNKFQLPPLKVLIKDGFSSDVYSKLKNAGCIIFKKDLTVKQLTTKDVLLLTENENGIDVSFRDAIDPAHLEYYDWLSYEILNQNPSVLIVPFGSGELFTNILNINRKECLLLKGDNRFTGDVEKLKNCKFYGVTTLNPNSKYFKLCSYFFNCDVFNNEQMSMYKRLNVCHEDSKVVSISDDYFEEALEMCKSFNLETEASSLAGFAYYIEMQHKFKNEEKIIIVNTGKTKEIFMPSRVTIDTPK